MVISTYEKFNARIQCMNFSKRSWNVDGSRMWVFHYLIKNQKSLNACSHPINIRAYVGVDRFGLYSNNMLLLLFINSWDSGLERPSTICILYRNTNLPRIHNIMVWNTIWLKLLKTWIGLPLVHNYVSINSIWKCLFDGFDCSRNICSLSDWVLIKHVQHLVWVALLCCNVVAIFRNCVYGNCCSCSCHYFMLICLHSD